MSGQCVEKIKCPDCGGNNLQVFVQSDGSVDGCCFSGCFDTNPYKPDPYGDGRDASAMPEVKIKTDEERQAEVDEVFTYPTLSVPQRKLRDSTLEAFGAKTSLSEYDGKTLNAIYWPVTTDGRHTGWHVKPLWEGGRPYNVGWTKGSDLLNWSNAKESGAWRLIITEGPEDMASVYTMDKLYGKEDFKPAITSLPRGAGSAASVLTKHKSDITRIFREVVLCFDDDAAGHDAVKAAMLALPSTPRCQVKSVKLPRKDANECLMDGVGKAAYTAISFHATVPANSSLVAMDSLYERAKTPARYGELTWPWRSLQTATRGIRYGETIYIGAAPKMGKGEIRDTLAAHFMTEDKVKIMVGSFEAGVEKTTKMILGKVAGRIFHDPTVEFDEEAYDQASERVAGMSYLVDKYQTVDWDGFKADLITSANLGAKVGFCDPITNFTNGMSSSDANTLLSRIAQESSEIASDYQMTLFFFCHLKSHEGDISAERRQKYYKEGQYMDLGTCPHGRGGSISSPQFAGSRAMERSCHMMIGLEGNKDPELKAIAPGIQNTRQLVVLESREFPVDEKVRLHWNDKTGQFKEIM